MAEFEIRYAYGPRRRSTAPEGGKTMVQQSLKDETDINKIMAKYEKHGVLTHVMKYAGDYGDFSTVPDYREGLDRVIAAQNMFMELPAKIRDRFGNNPANFIEFATTEGNIDELRAMGLAPPAEPPPKPQLVQVVDQPDDADASSKKAPKEPSKAP